VDVFVHAFGHVVIYDMRNALDVQASGGDGRGHEDRKLAALEVPKSKVETD
jgi:hypothetical protein